MYLHFDDGLQGLGLGGLGSCFVPPVQLLRDTDTAAVSRAQGVKVEGGMSRVRRKGRRRRGGPGPGGKGDGRRRVGVAAGLDGGRRPRGGHGEGGRALEGGGEHEGGVVGGAGGGEEDGVEGEAVGRRRGLGEGGGERVAARVEGRGPEGGRDVEGGRDGDGRRGGEEVFPSRRASHPPRVHPAVPHPPDREQRREPRSQPLQPPALTQSDSLSLI